MQQKEAPQEEETTYCLRHPQIETRLRCGRCGALICPRCMVTTPVGARCPDCARIGRPKALDTSAVEMGRAVTFGLTAAIGGALALTGAFWVLTQLPQIFDLFVVIGGMIGLGYLVGEAVRIGSGNKLDRRLKYVAAGLTFTGWVAGVVMLIVFQLPLWFLAGPYGIIGMVVGLYISMFRVRVP